MSRSPLSRPQSLLAAGGMCAVSLVFLLFIASPVQAALGMTGLLLTELGLLALALGGARLLGEPLRTVFPLARPRLRPTAGAVVLWLGIYAPVLLVAILMQLLLPQHTAEVSTSITGLISTVPLWLRFLIVAVSPAICEEAVYRGFILHHLGVLPPWARVLLCGALFGVFHLDVTRFGSTALLGVALSWAAVCTGNLFYPALIHLCNNSVSVLAIVALEMAAEAAPEAVATGAEAAAAVTPATLGVYFLLCAPSPWLLWAGTALLQTGAPRRPGRAKRACLCLVLTLALLAAGFALILSQG